MPDLIKGYKLEDIFNADEFEFFLKLLPDNSLVLPNETCHGEKLSKERFSFFSVVSIYRLKRLKSLKRG